MLGFCQFAKKDGLKTRQNDRGIAQVLYFVRVIFRKVRQLYTKSLKMEATVHMDGQTDMN